MVDGGARGSSSDVRGSVHGGMRRSNMDGGAALQGDDHEPKGVRTVTSSVVSGRPVVAQRPSRPHSLLPPRPPIPSFACL